VEGDSRSRATQSFLRFREGALAEHDLRIIGIAVESMA
jgi:hypothetical protein